MPSGAKPKDLAGQRFGRLIVREYAGSFWSVSGKTQKPKWLCRCDCGNLTIVFAHSLRRGMTKSCGCLLQEDLKQRRLKHGHAPYRKRSPTYVSWNSMRARCLNSKARNYEGYGGRGIEICERWLTFANFLADMGERPPGTSLERTDNNGNYAPDNCRWATPKEQASNTRRNRWVLWHGERMTATEAAKRMGLRRGSVHNYVRGQTPPPPGLTIL